ncbi:MAG: hypothetical protein Q8R13_02130 [bacterium]|nr:hypothetical protein [bacterium]MDZ4295908.1 hypothetical protein [Patescibacteria group bacterium]
MHRESAFEQSDQSQRLPVEKPGKERDRTNPDLYYEAIGSEYGPVAEDIERAYHQMNRLSYIGALKAGNDLQELYFMITDLIEAEPEELPAYTEQILSSLREAAREEKWQTYEDVKADSIREKLTRNGVPLRERRQSSDYQ